MTTTTSKRFEAEPRAATKPPEFDEWIVDLADIADTEGSWTLITAWMYAPVDSCRYLMRFPGLVDALILRARYTDQQRTANGTPSGTLST